MGALPAERGDDIMKKVRGKSAALFLALGAVVLLAAACDPYFPSIIESKDTPPQEISPLLVPRPKKSNFRAGEALDPATDIEVNKLTETGSMTRLDFNAGEFTVTLTGPNEATGTPVPPGGTFSFNKWGDWTVAVRTEDLAAWTYPIAVSDDSHLLKVAVIKNSYRVNERIDPVNDLEVYKAGADGEMAKLEYSALGTGFHLEIVTESSITPIDPASYVFSSEGPRTIMVKDNQKEAASYIYGITVSVSEGNYEPLVQAFPLKTVDPGTRIDPDTALAVYIQNLTAGGMEKIPEGTGPKQFSISPETVPADAYGPVEIAITVHGYPGSADETTVTCTLSTMTKGAVIEPLMLVIPYKTAYASTEAIDTATDLAVYIRDTTTGEMLLLDSGKFTVEPKGALGAGNNPRTVTVTVPDYPAGIKTERSYNVWVDTQTAAVTPTLLVVPVRTKYTVGDKFNESSDVVVYKTGANGQVTKLSYAASGSKTGFNLKVNDVAINPATYTFPQGTPPFIVTVTDKTGEAGSSTYSVTVSAAFTAMVQVIPLKLVYTSTESIHTTNDLAVYTRNLTTGEMTKISYGPTVAGKFSVSPTGVLGTTGGNTRTVTVTAIGYPSGTNSSSSYSIRVDTQTGTTTITPSLIVVPIKKVYLAGEKISTADDLMVYKTGSNGVTSRISWAASGTGYSLKADGTVITPSTYTPAQGTRQITVVDNAAAPKADPVPYTITVNQPVKYTVTFNKNTADGVEGLGSPNLIVEPGQTITVPAASTVSRLGHTFDGWYRTDDCSGDAWKANDTVTANITLYAKWKVDIGYGTIRYVDGSDGTLMQNVQGKWVAAAPQDKVIYSVTFKTSDPYYPDYPYSPAYPYYTYYLGRKGNEAITLNITENGVLNWRPADSDGYIPVSTADELLKINSTVWTRGLKYRLEADVDLLGGYNVTGRTIARREWTPIGNASTPFTGEFEGSGKVVSNMYIGGTGGTDKGFFGYLNSAAVRNLGVNALITGNNMNRAGAVAGNVDNESSLERCYNRGFVTPGGTSSNIGGVAGYIQNGSRLSECYNAGNVTPGGTSSHVGGVAGYAVNRASLSGCYNVWKVSGTNNTGGVVGTAAGSDLSSPSSNRNSGSSGVVDQAAIVYCYNEGEVKGSELNTGGIAGELTYHQGTLSGSPYTYISEVYGCWNKGSVNGKENTGGIAGKVSGAYIKASITAGSPSSKGRLSANWSNCLGGIAGLVISVSSPAVTVISEVLACYVTESVTNGGLYVGGIAGKLEGGSKVSACYVSAEIESPDYGGVVGDAANGGGVLKSNWWNGALQLLWTSAPANGSDDNWSGVFNPAGNAEAYPFWGPDGYRGGNGVLLDPGFGQPWPNLGTPGLDDVLWNRSDLWDIRRGPLVGVGRLPRLSWENNGEYGPDR
jgi:uncharacterized repeat protein (TIGR02543 family)